MSLAKRFNRVLHHHTRHFAAWSPVTDPFAVGDYGLFRGGIFRRLGHIREFDVQFVTEPGHPAAFDFSSSKSTSVRIQAGVEVPAFQNVDIAAMLKIGFEGEFLALVKAPAVDVEVMQSSQSVALRLSKAAGWQRRFRVVWKVYSAKQPVIVVSSDNDTTVELSGSAKALRKFELGEATIGVSVNGKHDLKIVGAEGPIALDLFRVKPRGAIPLLGAKSFGSEAIDDDENLIDGSENWPADDDDPEP